MRETPVTHHVSNLDHHAIMKRDGYVILAFFYPLPSHYIPGWQVGRFSKSPYFVGDMR